ncbi:MAG: metalloregulator ArsR/SmtB family transcription factor [Gemmatimonas sp.]|nr:metalloregulator ArsR/SmtB family transcription factor [Gemmatimonas sp.]
MITESMWTALGDPMRRAIFERLVERPRAVGELAAEFPISRPAVSQHLKVLKDAGLVVDQPAGNRRIYHVDPVGVDALRAQLDRFWSKALTTYKEVVEHPTQESSMTIETQETSVRTQIVVAAPIQRAFRVFTEQFDRIKPREHNMLGVDIAETVFEPRVGGHVYDRGVDGRECRWARVLAYEPPHRVVISWDINPRWQVETDLERTSEVEIRFTSESPERTRVELEHRNLDRHGESWEALRDGVASESGWPLYLQKFGDLIED